MELKLNNGIKTKQIKQWSSGTKSIFFPNIIFQIVELPLWSQALGY